MEIHYQESKFFIADIGSLFRRLIFEEAKFSEKSGKCLELFFDKINIKIDEYFCLGQRSNVRDKKFGIPA